MRFKLKENSLFAVLLRSPFWVSFAVAAGLFALVRLFLPAPYAVAGVAPFIVIGCMAGWRQLRAPSAKRIAARLEAIRTMPRDEFAAALEASFRREGYEVTRFGGPQADLELERGGRRTVVACRRWKATRTGAEPLRELLAAAAAREADDCIYIVAGDVTDNARSFAAEKRIRLLGGAELARMMGSGNLP
jgi:restriction system protein